MNEYFISVYGCESKTKNGNKRTCSKCSDSCEQRELLYRCWVEDLTDDESRLFKQEVIDSQWTERIFEVCVVHSTKDIPLNTVKAKKEHYKARMKFEKLPKEQKLPINGLLQIAKEMRYFRCSTIPDLHFIRIPSEIYVLEKKILSEKIELDKRKIAKEIQLKKERNKKLVPFLF